MPGVALLDQQLVETLAPDADPSHCATVAIGCHGLDRDLSSERTICDKHARLSAEGLRTLRRVYAMETNDHVRPALVAKV